MLVKCSRATELKRRRFLTGLALAPVAVLSFAETATASTVWITLSAGGTGKNRFKHDTDGRSVWAKCYNVTYKGKPVTGSRPCKLTFASGPSQDATVRLDKNGNGETGEYEDTRGRIIGVKVCV